MRGFLASGAGLAVAAAVTPAVAVVLVVSAFADKVPPSVPVHTFVIVRFSAGARLVPLVAAMRFGT